MTNTIKQLSEIVPMQENYPLADLTTFRVGGPAKYFCEIKSIDKLQDVLKIAKDNDLPVFVIGGGSNLLISDKGFDGLVIKLNLNVLNISDDIVEVSADIILNDLVDELVDDSLTGLEGLAGIPGTVGGATVGNAGAYGDEICNAVVKVSALDTDYNLIELQNEDLHFKYRYSIFKERKMIMLVAKLKLAKGNKEEIVAKVLEIRKDRASKHPPFPSAGCTFKNIELTKDLHDKLDEFDMDLPAKFVEYKKVPVAWLLQQLDLKGKQIGGAQISEKHGNFIVNKDHASADDIATLISYVKQQVRDKTGVQLQEEVRYIGFDK